MPDLLAVGCYTPVTGGRGAGISLVERDRATGRLGAVVAVLPTPSPSFLAGAGGGGSDGRRLVHAAHELAEGLVSTWSLPTACSSTGSPAGQDDGADHGPEHGPDEAGVQLAQVPSGGGSPCHVAVHPGGRLLVVCDYDGSVGVLTARDGVATELAQVITPRAAGAGPHADRQAGPHPHSAVFLDERHVVVADLGADELRVHAVEVRDGVPVRLDPEPVQVVRTAPGCGPRTVLRRAGRLHVTGELDATLLTAPLHDGRVGHLVGAPVTAAGAEGRRGQPSEVTPLGEHLLVTATRGLDLLTVHAPGDGSDDDGARTRAVLDLPLLADGLDRPPARNPRHVVALGRHLYVSAQDSDLVLHLELAGLGGTGPADDAAAGAGVRVVGRSAVRTGSPTVVLPL